MNSFFRNTLTLMLLLAASAVLSAIPSKPSPERLVNDFAGIFTQQQIFELEHMLVDFDDSTSNQIAVVTVTDLEGYTPAEFATRIGIDWQIGKKGSDNGIVVLVKPKTGNSAGEVNISVGYGLEGAIPDAYAKRIIENEMIPRFKENNYYGGVSAACDILMKLASGEISEPYEEDGHPIGFFIILFLLILLILYVISQRKGGGGNGGDYDDDGNIRRHIIMGHPMSRSNGGPFGNGGSFRGFGGGSFGGGGASGRW